MSGWDDWGLGSLTSKLESAVAYVQEDIQEFVGTVTGDAGAVAATTVGKVASARTVEGGAATMLDQVTSVATSVVTSLKEDSGPAGGAAKRGGASSARRKGATVLGETREEALVREVRHDPATYLTKPKDEVHFKAWSETFDLAKQVTEVSSLLSTDSALRKLHAKLVPRKISYNQFWIRYFYALHLIHEKEQKRKALLDRFLPKADDGDGDGGWGDDTWGEDNATDAATAAAAGAAAASAAQPPQQQRRAEPKPPLERDERKLRMRIKEFDDAFVAEHGRKPTARDRRPIQDVVLLYKELKAAGSGDKGAPPAMASEAPAPAPEAAEADSGDATPPAEEEEEATQASAEAPEEASDAPDAGAPAPAPEEPAPEPAMEEVEAPQPATPTPETANAEDDALAEDDDDGAAAEAASQPDERGGGLDEQEDHDEDDDEVTFAARAGNDLREAVDAAAAAAAAAAASAGPATGGDGGDGDGKREEGEGGSPNSSEDSNLGVQSVPSSSEGEGGRTDPGSSSSSFEVLESPVTPPADSPVDPESTPAAAAAGDDDGEGDDWGDW